MATAATAAALAAHAEVGVGQGASGLDVELEDPALITIGIKMEQQVAMGRS